MLSIFGLQSRNSNYEDDTQPEMIRQTARLLAGIHSAQPAISGSGFTAWRQTFLEDASGHLPPLYQGIQEKQYLEHLEKESPEVKEKYCKYLLSPVYRHPLFLAFNYNLLFFQIHFLLKSTSARRLSICAP